MVVLNKIYTRTGDDGTTALGTGERVPKNALRIAAYGTVDETNASIGMVRVHLGDGDPALDAMLVRIQNDLFDLGADLCVPDRGAKLDYEPLRMTDGAGRRGSSSEIDEMNAELKPLRSFVLPGGSPAAAALHVARTVSPPRRAADGRARRRAERAGQRRGAEIYQSPVGFPVRRQPLRQRSRQERRALGARPESVAVVPRNSGRQRLVRSAARRQLAEVHSLSVRHGRR